MTSTPRTQTRALLRFERNPRRWLAIAGIFGLRYVAALPHLFANLFLHIWVASSSPIAMATTAYTGAHPEWARRQVTVLLRRSASIRAWVAGTVDTYPPFANDPSYPVKIDAPRTPATNRVLATLGVVLLRAVGALPAAIAALLVGLAASAAAWGGHWVVAATGRPSPGINRFIASAIQLASRTTAWAWGLQDEYPPVTMRES